MDKKIKSGLLLLALSISAAACSNTDDKTDATDKSTTTEDKAEKTTASSSEAETIVDVAASNDDFSTLVAAIEKAGLAETLEGEGPYTVFAPTNEAFEDALKTLDITQEELLERDDLADILKYHVLPAKVDAKAAMAADGTEQATLLDGNKVKISVEGEEVKVNEATVTQTDLMAGNGIVHVVDQVLLPASK